MKQKGGFGRIIVRYTNIYIIMDLYMPKGKGLPVVTITGKGNKKRRCPLWDNTRKELRTLIGKREPDDFVFVNRL
jgi:integrase